jgi:ABC-2 type transport system permease protein
LRRIGHLTPQAWAVDAWTSLLSRSGTIFSIAPQLAVLGAFAALFLVSATVRLHRFVA